MKTIDEICRIFLDDPNSIFYVLSHREKQVFRNRLVSRTYRKGEYIFRVGDIPNRLICLAAGKAKVFQEGAGGREQIVRMAKPIGFIGYRALFAGEIHAASAVAIEESEAVSLDRETLLSIMDANSRLCQLIIKSLAAELGFSYYRTVTLTQKQMPGRLAESLLFLKETYGFENDGVTLKICLSREDIAKLSNMSTSNAIRTLSVFAGHGLIGIEGKKIKLIDIPGLEEMSDERRFDNSLKCNAL
ncbi:MAG: Crp/Fnr family transcriptional regulator [Bacteroidales bacterium]|jgi:CRP-like cAMP-binding protein|nr:Crp/Fnr family transcriptional regulator [Bacteroidales bacterium]